MKNFRLVIVLLVLSSSKTMAVENGYWSAEIPTPDYAENIESDSDLKYFVKKVEFDVVGIQPDEVGNFYSAFFSDLGWADPMAGNGSQHSLPGGWSGYRMGYNQFGKPEAVYVRGWKSSTVPASGNLQLVLTDYLEDGFSGRVKVTIAPEVDMTPLMKLNHLLGNDPKNLFYLHKTVGSNPFEVQSVAIPADYKSGYSKLLTEYYEIISEIAQQYFEFGEKYLNQ